MWNRRTGPMSASWWAGSGTDTEAALAALNALYADLRIFQNLFQPSMKLARKERVGSRLIRRYDRPQTPFERVRACLEADPQKVAALEQVLKTTDPFALSQRIDCYLERLWGLATRATRTPREAAPWPPQPRARTPWRGWTFSPTVQRQKQAMRHTELPPGGSDMDRAAIAPYKGNTEAVFLTEHAERLKPGRRDRVARLRHDATNQPWVRFLNGLTGEQLGLSRS